jgi:hypothetical protein
MVNMLCLALRLVAITLGLLGIVACAHISATVFERTAKNTTIDMEDFKIHDQKTPNDGGTCTFSQDGSDTVYSSTSPLGLSRVARKASELLLAMIDALDISSNRTFGVHKKLPRVHYVWAPSAAQMHPAIV